MKEIKDARLYGILDMGYTAVENMQSTAESLLQGGVDVLQLRAKGYSEQEVVQLVKNSAPDLLEACHSHGTPLIINDFPQAAVELQADGIHIGQDDGSLAGTRKIVGAEMLVGRSTHSLSQARAALEEGVDYIGFGPLFPTPTKKGRPGIGLENITTMEEEVGCHIPAFCIGGIKPENLNLVLASGAQRIVIVSALLQAPCIVSATGLVKSSILES